MMIFILSVLEVKDEIVDNYMDEYNPFDYMNPSNAINISAEDIEVKDIRINMANVTYYESAGRHRVFGDLTFMQMVCGTQIMVMENVIYIDKVVQTKRIIKTNYN